MEHTIINLCDQTELKNELIELYDPKSKIEAQEGIVVNDEDEDDDDEITEELEKKTTKIKKIVSEIAF